MSSNDLANFGSLERQLMLDVACASIDHGLQYRTPLPVNPANFPEKLREKAASFVTLKKQGQLRGCIGTLQAIRPLIEDVAHNAFAAAFSDPRFPPLEAEELPALALHITVLTSPEEIHFTSEEDLLRQLVPGEDGLILQENDKKGTFLPAVWEQLPDKKLFLQHLKHKIGLPKDYWSEALRAFRYRARLSIAGKYQTGKKGQLRFFNGNSVSF